MNKQHLPILINEDWEMLFYVIVTEAVKRLCRLLVSAGWARLSAMTAHR